MANFRVSQKNNLNKKPLIYCCLFGFSLLSACASIPKDIEKIKVKSPNAYSANSIGSLHGAWPNERWWYNLGDSQLSSLIERALSNSPSLDAANQRIAQALYYADAIDAAGGIQGSVEFDPYVQQQSYNGLFPKSMVPKGFKDFGQLTLSAKKDIDIWGQRDRQIIAALSNVEASEADKSVVEVNLSTAIANEYANLAGLYSERAVLVDTLNVKTQTAKLIAMRYKSGLEIKPRLEQANADIAAANLMIKTQDEKIELEKSAIAALVGLGPDIAKSIRAPNINLSSKISMPSNVSANLAGRRADIVAARFRVEAATNSVDADKTKYYPNISISGSMGLSSLGLNKLLDPDSFTGTFGPAISLPIFAQKSLDAQLRTSQTEYNLAVVNYNQTVLDALNEIARIMVSYRAINMQTDSAKASYLSAKSAYDSINLRYKGGLITYIDVLNAENAMLGAKRNLVTIENRNLPIKISLIKALGGGYSEFEKR